MLIGFYYMASGIHNAVGIQLDYASQAGPPFPLLTGLVNADIWLPGTRGACGCTPLRCET